jgi:hypothetical protein
VIASLAVFAIVASSSAPALMDDLDPPPPPATTEPVPIEPRLDDEPEHDPLPLPDQVAPDDKSNEHNDAEKPHNVWLPIVQAGAGAAMLAGAPFVANIATQNAGGAILLALSTYPGMVAMLSALALVVIGVDLISQGEDIKDDCCGFGAICAGFLEAYGYMALISGVLLAVAAPFVFWTTIGADNLITGHEVKDPALPLLAASGGALAGAVVFVGGAYVDEAADVDDGGISLMVLAAGAGVLGATTGYVLAR